MTHLLAGSLEEMMLGLHPAAQVALIVCFFASSTFALYMIYRK